MWEGRDFPKESEILYAEGMILASTIPSASRSGSRVGAIEVCENAKECHRYHCGYSAYHSPALQSCFNHYKNLEPYHKKQAKVGYYYQKDFLWLHNPHRQMVSLEIEGKTLTNYSYNDTKLYIKRNHKHKIISNTYLFVILMLAYYFSFVFFERKSKNTSDKTNI